MGEVWGRVAAAGTGGFGICWANPADDSTTKISKFVWLHRFDFTFCLRYLVGISLKPQEICLLLATTEKSHVTTGDTSHVATGDVPLLVAGEILERPKQSFT